MLKISSPINQQIGCVYTSVESINARLPLNVFFTHGQYRNGRVFHGMFVGPSEAYRAQTPQEHFSTSEAAFFACIDMAVNQQCERLDKNKPGLKTHLLLEQLLTTGELNGELCDTSIFRLEY